jgi:uncharacterized membrane protein
MYIIFLIIAVAFLVHQNSRINHLEELIKKNLKPSPLPETKPVSNDNVSQSVAQPSVPTNTVTPPVSHKGDISDEEVSGRILGRIGISAVIIGIAFFLKYAYDNNWINPAGRVMIGILIGVFAMCLGQYFRKKYLQYSDLLMGGGLAILYLSVLSSYALYHIVDPMFAFLGMIVVTAIGVIISIVNATTTLSMVAFIGGYLAPTLIGLNLLGAFIVFTYITILNAGTLGILLYKKWTNLVIVGFIGTWVIFTGWYVSSYTEEMLFPTLIFVLIQFLIFTASSVFRIIVEKIKATELDYFVITTTALSFACICYQILMPEYKHYVSLGSVLIAAFYVIIALIAYKENPQDRTINIFLPGLAVSFLTIAVPIEFSGPWISAWWFVEALVLYILASTSSSRGFQIMGVIVYFLGVFDMFYYLATYERPENFVIFFNGPFIMIMFSVMTAYFIAFVYYRYGSISDEIQKRGIATFVVIANILTLYALTTQVVTYYELKQLSGVSGNQIQNWSNTTVSLLWALYAGVLTTIGFVKKLSFLRYLGLVLFIITSFKVVIDIWSLGEIYRIISFIVFGVIALTASFVYVRYRERLKSDHV